MAVAAVSAQMPKYGVTVKVAKNADPAKYKTYAWIKGRTVCRQGYRRADRGRGRIGTGRARYIEARLGKGDVLVTYYSLRRTDVDLKAKPDASGAQPQHAGRFMLVAMLDPGTRGRLVRTAHGQARSTWSRGRANRSSTAPRWSCLRNLPHPAVK